MDTVNKIDNIAEKMGSLEAEMAENIKEAEELLATLKMLQATLSSEYYDDL